jgi:hypothetical protein
MGPVVGLFALVGAFACVTAISMPLQAAPLPSNVCTLSAVAQGPGIVREVRSNHGCHCWWHHEHHVCRCPK